VFNKNIVIFLKKMNKNKSKKTEIKGRPISEKIIEPEVEREIKEKLLKTLDTRIKISQLDRLCTSLSRYIIIRGGICGCLFYYKPYNFKKEEKIFLSVNICKKEEINNDLNKLRKIIKIYNQNDNKKFNEEVENHLIEIFINMKKKIANSVFLLSELFLINNNKYKEQFNLLENFEIYPESDLQNKTKKIRELIEISENILNFLRENKIYYDKKQSIFNIFLELYDFSIIIKGIKKKEKIISLIYDPKKVEIIDTRESAKNVSCLEKKLQKKNWCDSCESSNSLLKKKRKEEEKYLKIDKDVWDKIDKDIWDKITDYENYFTFDNENIICRNGTPRNTKNLHAEQKIVEYFGNDYDLLINFILNIKSRRTHFSVSKKMCAVCYLIFSSLDEFVSTFFHNDDYIKIKDLLGCNGIYFSNTQYCLIKRGIISEKVRELSTKNYYQNCCNSNQNEKIWVENTDIFSNKSNFNFFSEGKNEEEIKEKFFFNKKFLSCFFLLIFTIFLIKIIFKKKIVKKYRKWKKKK